MNINKNPRGNSQQQPPSNRKKISDLFYPIAYNNDRVVEAVEIKDDKHTCFIGVNDIQKGMEREELLSKLIRQKLIKNL